jgi:hypothetical protein
MVGAICAVTFVASAFGVGPTLQISLWTKPDLPLYANQEGRITVLSPTPFIVGGPEGGGHFVDVLKAAHAAGARQLSLDRSTTTAPFFNPPALLIAAREAGMTVPAGNEYSALGPNDVYVTLAQPDTVDAPPCARVPGGDVYLLRGPDVRPLAQADNLWCPTRSQQTYAVAGAAQARQPTPEQRRLRAEVERMLRAAHEQGIRQVFFEDSVVSEGNLGGAGALYAQAREAGLQAPAGGRIANLSSETGMYVYLIPSVGRPYPQPCVALPGGAGLVAFRGTDKQTPFYAENLYCPTRTPSDYKGPLAD